MEPDEEKVHLTPEQVDELLVDGDEIHTFVSNIPGVLMGCDVARNTLIQYAREYGAELAGEKASAMGHGVAVWRDREPIFCATKKGGA